MARVVLVLVSAWGLFFAGASLWGIASDVLTAQHVHLSGWTVQLTSEHRSGGYSSGEYDEWSLLFLPYFIFAGVLFLTVAARGHVWLRSPHRRRWFGGCAIATFALCIFGMISGFILFGIPLFVFFILALTRQRPVGLTSPSGAIAQSRF